MRKIKMISAARYLSSDEWFVCFDNGKDPIRSVILSRRAFSRLLILSNGKLKLDLNGYDYTRYLIIS